MAQESHNQRAGTGDTDEHLPDKCLSLTVSGPWGHFRRVEGNVVKQTYRVIPRTTVAGLLAAVLGIERDGYYELFAPDESWIAIEPVAELRTLNMPMNTLSTAAGDLSSLNARGKISVKLPNPTKLRQQHNYEVLVEPAYRIDVALSDEDHYHKLQQTLEAGKSHYTPSLGLSEYLAEISYHGQFDIRPGPGGDQAPVDSAVPNAIDNVVLEPDTRCQTEESPAFMTTDSGGRTTTAFATYAYNPDGGSLVIDNVDAHQVDDRTVMFV